MGLNAAGAIEELSNVTSVAELRELIGRIDARSPGNVTVFYSGESPDSVPYWEIAASLQSTIPSSPRRWRQAEGSTSSSLVTPTKSSNGEKAHCCSIPGRLEAGSRAGPQLRLWIWTALK